jgi:hypothetical protein
MNEAVERMSLSTRLPPAIRRSTGENPRARRREAFVSGGFLSATHFSFVGYREREWLPPLLDPDLILKPRLVGMIEEDGPAVNVSYQISVGLSAVIWYVLASLAVLFAVGRLVLALAVKFTVPGVSCFVLLLGGICSVFAVGIWETIPNAQADEEFLLHWNERVLS